MLKRKTSIKRFSHKICLTDTSASIDGNKFRLIGLIHPYEFALFRLSSNHIKSLSFF